MESMDFDQFMIHQLNNKLTNQPVLIDRLIIANLYDYNPRDFFSEGHNVSGTKECYILSPRRLLYGIVCRPDRQAGNGYWKRSGNADRKIFGMNGIVGVKQNLCFYEGHMNHGHKTSWKMMEYRLQDHHCPVTCDHKSGRLDNWVLCKVYEDHEPEALSSQLERMNI